MKIAYISLSTIPSRMANSIHVMKMCQAFARAGHDVTLLVPDHTDIEQGVSNVYSFYGVINSFAIKKLAWPRLKRQAWVYGWLAAWHAKQSGVELVYGRHLNGCLIAALMGLPTICELHAMSQIGTWWGFKRLINASGFRQIVVISEVLKQDVLELYPELENRIVVVHDAADPVSDEATVADLGTDKTRLQVGYVGHLYPGRMYEVVEPLAGMVPWADFHVVGGDKDRVESLCRADLRKNVFLHGFVPPAQTERYRLACDVLLAPYQLTVQVAGGGGNTVRWMSPLKLFEYMAAGKAIICSDIPVLREVLDHEKTALLCPHDNIDAWKRALERLRGDISLRKRLGYEAQRIFLKHYTWKARAEKVLM